MARRPTVELRRVYADADTMDGTRVLVDGMWPRGVRKADAPIDEWCKQVAPSTELRKWYGHDPQRYAEFARRYRTELTDPERADALARLRELAAAGPLTLLTATLDPNLSHATVLAEVLAK